MVTTNAQIDASPTLSPPVKPSPLVPIRLSTVVVPEVELRFSTNIAGLDQCLAENEELESPKGLPYGCSVLLSGMPGGGKSTIATFLLAAATGRDNLYFHGEERAERVKQRWDRLGLKQCDPYLAPLRAVEDALDVIRTLSASGKGLGVVVVDSVQCLTLGGKRKYDHQAEACEMLAGQVCSAGGTLILVSHVSKTGQDHAGAAALSHMVDIFVHLTNNSKSSQRNLEVRKNRMGRAGFQVPMNISISGLSVGVPAPLANNPAGAQAIARSNLEKAAEVAYTMLLTGEPVSNYDHDKAALIDSNISMGMWRAGLEMASKRLIRDKFEVVEVKIKGRKNFRVENPPTGGSSAETALVNLSITDQNELDMAPSLSQVPDAPHINTPIELD